jgi:hypothetical protein
MELPGNPPKDFNDVATALNVLKGYFNSVGVQFPRYLVATLPTTATEGTVVFVADGAAGTKFRGWDGSAWVNLG